MKTKSIIIMAFLALMMGSLSAQTNQGQNSRAKVQKEFLKWKYGVFLHFNMGTFVNREWATGYEDPLLFNPASLNCEQWIKTIKSAGMNYAVLTTKHTGGWCLWNSKYTTHDIEAFKNYKNGKGDIVREFVNACRKYKVKVGLYYCLPGDYSTSWGSKEDERKGYKITKNQEDLHGLPPEAKGDYEAFIEKQITELLTNYGKIDYMFFDQYNNKYTGAYWLQLKALVNKLQPQCVINANNSHDFNQTDVMSFEFPYLKSANKKSMPSSGNQLPSELCDCLAVNKWFWNNEAPIILESPASIAERYKQLRQCNCNYLLDVPPSKNGLIEENFVSALKKIKQLIDN